MPITLVKRKKGKILLIEVEVKDHFTQLDIKPAIAQIELAVSEAHRQKLMSVVFSGDWSLLDGNLIFNAMEMLVHGRELYSHPGLLAISAYSSEDMPEWVLQIMKTVMNYFQKPAVLSRSLDEARQNVEMLIHQYKAG